jgi:bacillopeptidase F
MQGFNPGLGAACAVVLATLANIVQAAAIAPELERAMGLRGTHADTAVILRFADPLDLQSFAVGDRRARDNRLLVALKAQAAKHRAAIEPLLAAQEAVRITDLWIINGLAATVPALAVKRLAGHPAIARIELDAFVRGGRSQRMPQARASTRSGLGAAAALPAAAAAELAADPAPAEPGWNIAAIRAPELWALGERGEGVVVATMDTGVDLGHPQLRRKWRGGANSWFDPHGEETTPYDALGHGTQAMGVMVGGSGLGVAPGARWIAVKLYDGDGRARMSDIHLAFQWLMDPDGDPATIDAPDVVNASWALTGRAPGACSLEFSDDIRALRTAGIALVFAAGNDGPGAATSSSPGNNPGALSVGAVDRDFAIARQASRGPSACDGAVFPRLVAPGVNVRTADLSHGGSPSYTVVSGSSLAAPHAAGVLALLAGAFPWASVAELEAALLRGARDLGAEGEDNSYGHGLVDALAAFNALRAGPRPGAALAPGDRVVGNSAAISQPTSATRALHARAPAQAEMQRHQR